MKKRYLGSLYFLQYKEIFQKKSASLLFSIIAVLLLMNLSSSKVYAQSGFTITEDFKGNSSQGIFLGGDAYLTSGESSAALKVNDSLENGWLRLTNAEKQKIGYALIEQSFSTTLGFLIDFEFVTWGGKTFADGISFFLYDSKYVTSTIPGPGQLPFKIGAPGEALGYSHRNNTLGVTGGYIGVGLDEWGYYGTDGAGKTGGFPTPGQKKNSLAIRGSATGPNAYRKNYKFLGGTENLVTKLNTPGFTSLDFQTDTQVRPLDSAYYRRVILSIVPTEENGFTQYRVSTKIKVDINGAFLNVLDPFLIDEAPPANVNLGFAGTTGAYTNIHEVRNVMITTPTGVWVHKKVNKNRAYVGDQLIYDIDLFSQSDQNHTNLKLSDVLPANFQPTSIVFNNNGNALNTASGYTQLDLSNVTIGLGAFESASFRVVGNVIGAPPNGILKNTAHFHANGELVDPDLTNDISTVETVIMDPKIYLEKSGVYVDVNNDNRVNVGDVIEYSFKVENTGNMKLSNVTITDPLITVNGGSIVLEVGESDTTTFTGSYQITQNDIDSGGVYNQATAEGKDLGGRIKKQTSIDPNPLNLNDQNYDPTRSDHTFVLLQDTIMFTNPNIYQKANGN